MNIIKAPYHFKGGIHPAGHKELSAAIPIEIMPPFAAGTRIRVPLQQHLGAPATPAVAPGDRVLRGQLVGAAKGFVSANVHAPTSGQVYAVDYRAPVATGQQSVPHVVIEADGLDERRMSEAWPDWDGKDAKALIGRIAEAGIVGMGGAGFPTHVKLSPPPEKKIDTLIINGAECEPYLTGDHRAMLEYPQEILEGVAILQHILGAKTVRIAIEEDKQDAIECIRLHSTAFDCHRLPSTAIVSLKAMYPQGSEKQLIYALTGRNVPVSGLPMDIGCLVENVGTVLAIRNAVVKGWALDERIVAVTGPAISSPRNFIARVGTPYRTLVEAAGGLGKAVKIIAGGPMMGFAQYTLDIAVTKTTSGILALRAEDCAAYESAACISCGRCNVACPQRFLPSEMGQFIEADDIDEAKALGLMGCFECGTCSYVCPARRPLVQHFRRAKAAVALSRTSLKGTEAQR